MEVDFHALPISKTHAIYPAEHSPFLVATPICACDPGQMKGLNHARRSDMWAATEVNKTTLRVKRYLFSIPQIFDQLHLIVFALAPEKIDGFPARYLFSDKRKIGLDDLFHLCLNLRQIFLLKRPFIIKIIVKAIFNSRTNSNLYTLKELLHGHGHHVRGTMSQYSEAFFRIYTDRFQLCFRPYRAFKIAGVPIDLHRHNSIESLDLQALQRLQCGQGFRLNFFHRLIYKIN